MTENGGDRPQQIPLPDSETMRQDYAVGGPRQSISIRAYNRGPFLHVLSMYRSHVPNDLEAANERTCRNSYTFAHSRMDAL